MDMKLSDYVAKFIENLGIKDIFLISGGGMMHLLDSVGRNKNINIICNLNEQATSICADSYGQFTNKLGVCLLTTGPGGTNAVTGIAASYLDSTPVLAISGQVKTSDFSSLRGVRQFGSQEIDIVSIVKPITKYAEIITDKNSIRYHLEKAVYLATHGRKGPVWIDIPLDIQGAQIDEEKLYSFDPVLEGFGAKEEELGSEIIKNVYNLLNSSKRPAFLIGHGLIASNIQNEFRYLAEQLNIPVLSTWRAKGVFGDDENLFFGHPGIPATRYSNYILQNSDLLIIIGTRLNAALTAYAERDFAPAANKIIIDIDKNEIKKLDMEFKIKLNIDSGVFIKAMIQNINLYAKINFDEWLEFCVNVKNKYPLENESQPVDNQGLTDGFIFADKLSNHCKDKDIIIGSSSGRTCGISHMAFKLKRNQKFISSMGLGSMGFVLPSAISCCIAGNRMRTVAIEGDGSLQHNLQELQLIANYNLPIKLFILSNGGYASIYIMQKNNFRENYVACNEATGVRLPLIADIAKTYQLNYSVINNNDEIDSILAEVMSDNQPAICEVKASVYFDEIPKSMTLTNKDGSFTSSKLENLYPFLSEDEVKSNMPNWSDKQ